MTARQFTFALIALLGTAFALPEPIVKRVDLANGNVLERDDFGIYKRADDDWLLVSYDTPGASGQCGGTDTSTVGKVAGACLSTVAKCVDFSVSLSAAATGMQCTAKFDSAKCGNTDAGSVTVKSGESTRGFNVGDTVRFIEVSCEAEE